MKPAAQIAAVIEILTEMRATSDVSRLHSRRAGQWLSSGFQRRRFAGSGDRAAIGDLFWKIQRASARLDWHLTCLDAPNSPRNMVLAALVLIERQVDELTQLFSADVEYAPSPIDTNEKKLVSALADRNLNDPAMPNHIAFEWPQWLMDDTKAGLGDAVVRELGALLVEAPTDVRINPLKFSDRRKLRDKMAGRNIKVHLTRLSPLASDLTSALVSRICLSGRQGYLMFRTKDRSLLRCCVMQDPVCKLLTFALGLVVNHW